MLLRNETWKLMLTSPFGTVHRIRTTYEWNHGTAYFLEFLL